MILAHGSIFHFNRRVTNSQPQECERPGNTVVRKLSWPPGNVLWVTLTNHANVMILLTGLTSLYPLPYPVEQSSNYRDPSPRKRKRIKKNVIKECRVLPPLLRTTEQYVGNPDRVSSMDRQASSLVSFKVMTVLSLITDSSMYPTRILTPLNRIPSYFLVDKVCHFLKSLLKCTCFPDYEMLSISLSYFKHLER